MTAAELDPRVNAFRPDLATTALKDRIAAPRYAEGNVRQVAAAAAPVRATPRLDARLETEALHGEVVTVYDESDGWAWGQLARDRYVGYLPADALTDAVTTLTHKVVALRSYVFPVPAVKAPPLRLLSLNAGLAVSESSAGFVALEGGGFVTTSHVAPLDRHAPDFVAVAERFLGTPYLWGGRTSLGLDCSALVQLSLEAAGIAAPRDSDMAETALGAALDPEDFSALRRGDLIFWKEHMGVMLDATRLLHANAHHMETAIEPVADAVARGAAEG
ncbi:MAG: C40 family peptidase, partial [Methyloligellaceae bacterium]